MPKMKTKSSAKKRFSLTATGKVRKSRAFQSHNLGKKPQKLKRQRRKSDIMNPSDVKIIKSFLPYGS